MSPFALMVDACFRAMGEDAVYEPADGSPAFAVRVIVKKLDSIAGFGATQVIAATAGIDVRVSEVPMPRISDRITLGGTTHVVGSDPPRDSERLVWTLSASPPALWDPSSGLPPGPVEGGGF
ncbi:MAG: hypothetical protein HQL34_09895 [Alphaproteobacteria bacterium]|nr:hypothetical protein [Alphaproteobacteria bacterium]